MQAFLDIAAASLQCNRSKDCPILASENSSVASSTILNIFQLVFYRKLLHV